MISKISCVYLSLPVTVIGRQVDITAAAASMGYRISSSPNDSAIGSSKCPKEQVPTIQRGILLFVFILSISPLLRYNNFSCAN